MPLSQINKDKLAAVTAEGWAAGQRNLGFAGLVYERIGLDIRSNGIGTLTFAGSLDAIFLRLGDTDVRDFLLMRKAPAGYEGLYNMLLPGYYGGPGIHTEEVYGLVTEYKISDLEVGDVVAAGSWMKSHYRVGVYQGNGQFLFSDYDTQKATDRETWYTEVMTDSTYAAFLTDAEWQVFYVLRPYLGYADINK